MYKMPPTRWTRRWPRSTWKWWGEEKTVTIVGREAVADQLDPAPSVQQPRSNSSPWFDGRRSAFFPGRVPAGHAQMSVEDPFDDRTINRPEDDVESISTWQPQDDGRPGCSHAGCLGRRRARPGPLPPTGRTRYVWDLILPTPTCPAGRWLDDVRSRPVVEVSFYPSDRST